MNTKKSKRIFIGVFSLVLIMALSLAGMLLISGTEYTYHDMYAYDWQDVLDAVATNPADYGHDGINIILQDHILMARAGIGPLAIPGNLSIPQGNRIMLSGDHNLFIDNHSNLIAIVVNGGHLTLNGPTIMPYRRSISATLLRGSNSQGVRVVNGGTFVMNAGEIRYFQGAVLNDVLASAVAVLDDGAFIMNGGRITENGHLGHPVVLQGFRNPGGGEPQSAHNATFTMNGGEIIDNVRGGVIVYNNATFTMNSGYISDNSYAPSGGIGTVGGGGVRVAIAGIFHMYGGEISGNRITNGTGGGVHVQARGVFVMHENAVIRDNTARRISHTWAFGNGGGVSNWGTFTMLGGEISGNTAEFGDTNTGTSNAGSGGGVFNAGTFTMNNGTISDNTSTPLAMIQGGGGGVWSSGIFTMNDGTISDNVIVDPSGGRAGGGGVLAVSGQFVMNNGTISGNTSSNSGGPLGGGGVQVGSENSVATFTMTDGTIRGNTVTPGAGGGVNVHSGSTFTMLAGEISDNNARNGAGVNNVGTFTMHNGYIINNTSSNFAGGVYNGGEFVMHNGAIDDNTGANHGGGVYVTNDSTFTMHNGTISRNDASWSGGGLMVGGTFIMYNGEINDNTAGTMSGGGVLVHGWFTMHNGLISGNSSVFHGGGVQVGGNPHSTFTMNGGLIQNNSSGHGAGVSVFAFATFTMNNGTINANTASEYGGGVYMTTNNPISGTAIFTVNAGSITNNTAGYDGGGIFVEAHPVIYRVPFVATDYPGLTVAAGVVFSGNTAGNGAFGAPESANLITRIASRNTSVSWHPLNNYDINSRGEPIQTNVTVTFLPGANGVFPNYVTYISFQVPVGTILTAANVPNIIENADWDFIGWATNPMTNPVGFVVNEDVTFVAQYETTYNGGSPNTGIYGFAIGAIALVTLGGVMFTFVKKADKASV